VHSVTAMEPRFERLRLVGEGATGRVELARLLETFGDLEAGHHVAVKTLTRHDDADAREAFRAEAEAGRLCDDPSLACVLFDGEDEEGRPYLLLPYVPGRTLREALAEGPLPEPLVRSVGAQLAGALATLHAAGLVHGDVKPENVRIDDQGRAVLLDLGFARRRPAGGESGKTRGSLAYLAPETVRGTQPDAEADVFALGVVLYELATGVHPFGHGTLPAGSASGEPRAIAGLGSTSGALLRKAIEAPDADRLLAAILEARFVPPSHLNLSLTPFFDQLLEEALARDPAGRPDARSLARHLAEGESGEWWRERVHERQRETAPALRPGRHLSALVGRAEELARLEAALAGVREGETHVLWIGGPEGCGKWRLVTEFAARARTSQDPPLYLYSRWNEVAESLPGGALLVLLHRWLRLPLGARPGKREEEDLSRLVGPRTARTLLAALNQEVDEGTERESVPTAIAAWLGALGKERPVLLFLDDLQLAGPVTREGLHALLGGLSSVPVLLVFGVRENAAHTTPSLERLRQRGARLAETRAGFVQHELHLAPMTRRDLRELVDGLFDNSVPRGRLAEVLWLRSRGNPGLATEILYDLIADGRARPRSDEAGAKLLLTIPPGELPLPRSLDRIVTERFQTLRPEDRLWLERLSVVGGRIAPDFLPLAFPPSNRAEIDETLARLVHLGWLVPVADRYRFARPALREALYRSLGERRRRLLHLAAARGLVAAAGDEPSPEDLFQRAFHLRHAKEPEEVLELVLKLIRQEGRRASARRLLTLARWGLEALDLSTPIDRGDYGRVRLELLETGAEAADRLGHRAEERALLDFMVDLDLDLAAYPAEGARLYLLHARYASGTGSFGLARGMLRNAIELATTAKDDALLSQSLRRLAQVQAHIGELVEARQLADRALSLARGTNQLAVSHLAVAQIDVIEDRLEHALRGVERAVRTLRGSSEVRLGVAAYANLMRARIWRSLGRPVRAMGAARRSVELARRSGDRRMESEARARLGGLLLDLDRASDAESELRDAQLLADEIEDRRAQVLARVWLGLLLWEEDHAEARAMIERGTELANEIGFYRAEAFGLAILARVWRDADQAKAERESLHALELVERHGAELADRIVVVGTRALVLRGAKQGREARVLVGDLRSRIAHGAELIQDSELRQGLLDYTTRLLRAVLSPDGPVLPRSRDLET